MRKTIYLCLAIVLVFGCKSRSHSDHGDHKHDGHDHSNHSQETKANGIEMKSGAISLKEAKSLPLSDAKLTVNNPKDKKLFKSLNNFDFDVENYQLGSQTKGKNAEHCANSAKGQHIHLILNNQPYSAHYESDFEKEVAPGSYIGLAFLSRSYHESIKSKDAYQLFSFAVGDNFGLVDISMESPHMFYSRPKGTYKGKDTEKVLLDFYLTNVELSENGYKVQAKINDEVFLINKWVPYVMEGLPMGENTIELTLLNKEGNKVDSPFNPVVRKVTLVEADS